MRCSYVQITWQDSYEDRETAYIQKKKAGPSEVQESALARWMEVSQHVAAMGLGLDQPDLQAFSFLCCLVQQACFYFGFFQRAA